MRYATTLVLALVAAGMAFGQADDLKYHDKVYKYADNTRTKPKSDPEQPCEVTDETYAKVKCNLGRGATTELNKEEIFNIIFDQGSDLKQAQQALSGDPATAAGLYKALLAGIKGGSKRKVLEQHAMWGYALSLHNQGDLPNAAAAYLDLISSYPNTAYIYGAAEKGVACFLGSRDAAGVAGAKATITKLQAVKPDDGGKFESLRDYLSGLVEETAGNVDPAMNSYKKVEGCRAPDVAAKGKLGVGRCLVLKDDFAGAERKFREVIDGGQATGMTLGGAWNGIGEVNFKQGEAAKNPKDKVTFFHTALMAYLRCAIQFNVGEGESWDEKGKAMARAGYCFEQVADAQDTPDNKQKYKDRARSMYQDCIGAVGAGGGWGKWASDHLNKMR